MPVDDGLPRLEPLCAEQASIIKAYAHVLADLERQRVTAEDEQAVGFSILLERIQKDAPWAVSEVRRSLLTKLRQQRYISQDVFDRWRQVQAQSKHKLQDFHVDADGNTLIHEHVVQRKGVVSSLKGFCDKPLLIAEALEAVTACVVSKAEDTRLRGVKNVNGWDRYEQAKPRIGVYDRKLRCWHIPRSLE